MIKMINRFDLWMIKEFTWGILSTTFFCLVLRLSFILSNRFFLTCQINNLSITFFQVTLSFTYNLCFGVIFNIEFP